MSEFQCNYTYALLKQNYLKLMDNAESLGLRRISNRKNMRTMCWHWAINKESFYGCTSKELSEWLHSGYKMKGLTLEPPILPVSKRRRLKFSDDGELQYELATSGFDYPYLDWEKRDLLPGMRVRIDNSFSSAVPASVVSEYSRWILRALVALETAGIDLEVWISCKVRDALKRFDRTMEINIQVKKEGEQVDYLGWSAMLSPGGWRHLGFLAHFMAADENGYDVKWSLGHTVGNHSWSVGFDTEQSLIKFNAPYHTSSKMFPESEMDLQLRDVLTQLRQAA